MARGLRRGPVLLRFRALVDSIAGAVAGIVDTRQLSKVRYTLRDCFLSALALFYVQDSSLLQFQRRFQRKLQANNLSSTFGVSRIPRDSQFRDLIDRHDYQPILPCFADFIGRLQRFKWLQHYQIFDARYLITLDGSRYFSSELVNCEHCLTTTKDGVTASSRPCAQSLPPGPAHDRQTASFLPLHPLQPLTENCWRALRSLDCAAAEVPARHGRARTGAAQDRGIAATLGVGVTSVATVRQQLVNKGMVWSQRHGETAFTVPLFDSFMKRQMPKLEKHVPARRKRSTRRPARP